MIDLAFVAAFGYLVAVAALLLRQWEERDRRRQNRDWWFDKMNRDLTESNRRAFITNCVA